MNNKHTLLTLCLLIIASTGAGQVIFPIDVHDGQTIETCSGVFTDSSLGDSLTHYGPNEDYHLVFTSNDPEQDHLMLNFEVFGLGEGDTLYVHDGENGEAPLLFEAVADMLSGDTIYSSDSSLYFHFVSSDFDMDDPEATEGRIGWYAQIGCRSLCDLFVAEIDPLDGLMFCPEELEMVSFAGSAGYLPENIDDDPDQFVYTWVIEEQTFSGQTVSYQFPGPGAYTVWLNVEDPQTGCQATAVVVPMVGTIPGFNGTMASDTIVCSEENFSLYGVVNMQPWTGFPIAVNEDPPFQIGTEAGFLYVSTLDFDVFPEGMEVLSGEDFNEVCVFVEHTDHTQLMFELESPDGTVVMLKDFGGPTANLGEPVVWDDDIPGVPYTYCFSPFPQFGTMGLTTPLLHDYTDNAGNYYVNAAYMPAGAYTPDESLDNFAGSPFNGSWTLRVEDHTIGESGHIFGWSLLFDDTFYPDSLIFVPEIVEEQWYKEDEPIPGNPALASIIADGQEVFREFRFEVTDNFGCTYDTTIVVQAFPLPEAEILSELEIPLCEGDSTLLSVNPLSSSGFDWLYQWQVGGTDLPGRTYDTLMVKEPGLYTAVISEPSLIIHADTLWCINYFDKDVTDQNCDLTIPNVFTPNADGINDEFEIKNLEHYPNAQMVIFNRWGNKVFEHNDYYNNWWDGANAPDGTYFYVLRYTRLGKTRYAEGTVTIIR